MLRQQSRVLAEGEVELGDIVRRTAHGLRHHDGGRAPVLHAPRGISAHALLPEFDNPVFIGQVFRLETQPCPIVGQLHREVHIRTA